MYSLAPRKTAAQPGNAGTKGWLLENAPGTARRPDPFMGWSSANDNNN